VAFATLVIASVDWIARLALHTAATAAAARQ
jgi:hypothetical protein